MKKLKLTQVKLLLKLLVMTTIYKTLFEIKLLHEFYLTDSKGESVFDFANQPDRLNFLQKKFELNRVAIDEDLLYQIPDVAKGKADNYRLRLIQTYSGFKVMIEVDAKKLGDGTLVFTPKIKLPENLNILIALIRKNRNFENVTSLPLKKDIAGVFYFTNDHFIHSRTFPFLTSAIPSFDAAATYEQGELASFGVNDIRQFYNDGTLNPWYPVKGGSFATKTDLLLCPPVFIYNFDASATIFKADFKLKDSTGTVIRTLSFNSNAALSKVNLNFNPTLRETTPLIALPDNDTSDKSIYTLDITLNDTITRTHSVLFWDSDHQFNDFWGVLNIRNQSSIPEFRLLDSTGYLKTKKLSSGKWEPAPVFEIGMKSRLLFWRYKNDKLRKLLVSTETTDFADVLNNDLVVKQPRSISYIPSMFKAADNTYHHLPNPDYYDTISSENGKLFLDIAVSESKMFPSAPG